MDGGTVTHSQTEWDKNKNGTGHDCSRKISLEFIGVTKTRPVGDLDLVGMVLIKQWGKGLPWS